MSYLTTIKIRWFGLFVCLFFFGCFCLGFCFVLLCSFVRLYCFDFFCLLSFRVVSVLIFDLVFCFCCFTSLFFFFFFFSSAGKKIALCSENPCLY